MDFIRRNRFGFIVFGLASAIIGIAQDIHYSRLRGTVFYPDTTSSTTQKFNFTLSSTNPTINLDDNDYLQFVKSTNRLDYVVGSAIVGSFIADGTSKGWTVGSGGVAGISEIVADSNIRVTFASGDYLNFAPSTNVLTYAIGGTTLITINTDGGIRQTGVTFANLGTPTNGTIIYCSDCTIANPCAGSGTGSFAKRLNGAWVCN